MFAPVLLLVASAFARPLLGVEWVPFSRGDTMWVSEGHTSGTGVAALDGWLQPALRFQGGIQRERWALLGGAAVARLTTTTWLGDGRDQTHVGALWLGLGYRRYFGLPAQHPVQAFAEAGGYGVIPSARQLSDSFTEVEQNDADEGAAYTRKSIGALGAWLGPGFGWWVHDQVMIGARYHLLLHRGQVLTEDALSISTALYSEAALVVETRL
ncbi:MAG: hypothetical protein ABIO70_09570 [Pseudomonadota bacterium]